LEQLQLNCQENGQDLPELLLEEFWPSEEYYFHDEGQMTLASRLCPKVKNVQFQFSRECVSSFSAALANFKCLNELHSWGGDFYQDGFDDFLTSMGQNLKVKSMQD